jgi:hypothetical protein
MRGGLVGPIIGDNRGRSLYFHFFIAEYVQPCY